MKPGTIVVRRPPALQPWIHPTWRGVVLEQCDPDAWEGSVAFPARPTRDEVAAWVAKCKANGGMTDFPVRWDFGPHGTRIYWESAPEVES